MRGAPFNLQQDNKGALEILAAAEDKKSSFWKSSSGISTVTKTRSGNNNSSSSSSTSCGANKRRKGELEEALLSEPRSVLDQRRSPSPPTSTSTLSSSLGGNSGSGGSAASSDTGDVAAVSDKWLLSSSSAAATLAPAANTAELEARQDEWAAELPPISASLDGGGEGGSSVEDWEAMLSEPAVSSGQDQSFLRWIMGDSDDAPAWGAHKHQLVSHFPIELDAGGKNGVGLPFPDHTFGVEGDSVSPAAIATAPLVLSSVTSGGELNAKSPNFVRGNLNTGNNHWVVSPITPPLSHSLPLLIPPGPGALFQDCTVEKAFLLGPSLLSHQPQTTHTQPNTTFFLPPPAQLASVLQDSDQFLLPQHHVVSTIPHLKRQAEDVFHAPPGGEGTNLFLGRHQPQHNASPLHLQPLPTKAKLVSGDEAAAAISVAQKQQQQQQVLVDQLFKAVELVQSGNSVSAHGILARLNHQLPSPGGKPLLRSVFYFKEALQLLTSKGTTNHLTPSTPLATPFDIMLKLRAYKAFSEASPVFQFINFTCVQAILEELGGADRIHIIDFDIGVGGQWSSFMQELAHRRFSATTATPLLKITALVNPCTHHPLELHLTRENLCNFASDLHIPFQFNALSLEPFDPSLLLSMSGGVGEVIAVHLPVSPQIHLPIHTLLHLMKQISPKIVVSVDHGCDHSDLPFAHHFVLAFQSCTVLLDSIDATSANQDSISDIERFLLQPRIESSVLGHRRTADKMLPWRSLFASAGFVPVQFSNFTETQAECLLKRVQVKGFHVEKHQASLSLCWQRGELVSVSAWKC